MAARESIVIALAAALAACSAVVQGRDNRDPATLTLAQPTVAGGGVGDSCGFQDDDECRPGLVCDVDECVVPDPPPEIACARDDQCPSSEICYENACRSRW